jgi:ABC-type lipopolysaccharide export system ATPase subunit
MESNRGANTFVLTVAIYYREESDVEQRLLAASLLILSSFIGWAFAGVPVAVEDIQRIVAQLKNKTLEY